MADPGTVRVSTQPPAPIRSLLARPVVGFTQDRFDQPIEVLPSPTVTLMFQIGQPFDDTPLAFAAGPCTSRSSVTWQGRVSCIDLKLSPVGAAALFGPVLHELADRTVDLDDLLPGSTVTTLLDQVASTPDWPSRLERVQRLLCETSLPPHKVDARVLRAWSELSSANGGSSISDLVRASGWSHRHFTEQFRRHTGLTPRSAARLLRVQGTMETLRRQPVVPLVEVALSCGYADQAHMTRELVRFTGFSPDRFRRDPRLVPAGSVPSAIGPPRLAAAR